MKDSAELALSSLWLRVKKRGMVVFVCSIYMSGRSDGFMSRHCLIVAFVILGCISGEGPYLVNA
jgi:hypothetical protein